MILIISVALCMVVISAESPPMTTNSYSSSASALNDYEIAASNYNEMSTGPYITTGSNLPYSKSDTRYAADSTGESDPRASITNSYYKTKYGSDAVINAIRPASFHPSSPSSLSSSQTSSSPSASASSSSEHQSNHYANVAAEYTSSQVASSSPNTEYAYGDRQQEHPSHHYSTELPGAPSSGTEYVQPGSSRPVFSSYTAASSGLQEYGRPTGFAHGGPPSPLTAAEHSSHPYHHPYHHHPSSYPTSDDYSSAPHAYKTYIMSNGPPSKYSSVMSALKSLFGGGSGPMLSDAASNANHHIVQSAYSSSPYYSSPLMHHTPGSYPSASVPSTAISSGSPYYFSSSLGPSSASAYSKSYPAMRLMSSYGGGPSAGGKIIVIRGDGSAGTHTSAYPTSSGSIIGSPSTYVAKNKIAYAASNGAPSYIPASSSSLSYSSGALSSAYPGSYSGSASFASHGSSPFLGYSV